MNICSFHSIGQSTSKAHYNCRRQLQLCAKFFFAGFCLALYSGSLLAQADIRTDRLLFQPVPLSEAISKPLVLMEAAGTNSGTNTQTGLQTGPQTGTTAGQELAEDEPNRILEINQAIAQYLPLVADFEAEQGPYSEDLSEALVSLAFLYQEQGNHAEAIKYYERSRSIIRVSGGLYTLEQLPIIEAMIPSFEAMGELKKADEMNESLLYIHTEEYGNDSVEIIPALAKLGEWNMKAFLTRSNILLNVNRMNVVQFMNDPNNFMGANNNLTDTPLFNLYQAQQNFLRAIGILIENKQYFHPQILELEQMLLKSYFLSIHRENILYEPDFYLTRKKRTTGSRLNTNSIELMASEEYKVGNASHQRSISYISNNPERTNTMTATAMLEAADWHLLFERKVKAAQEYQKVYDFFSEYPEAQAEIRALLYPDNPVILPVYLPPPNSREKLDIKPDDEVNYFGYFDVSFSINKYGKASNVRILSQEGTLTRNMEIRLNQYLRNVLFRPLFRDGQSYTDTLSLRYYVGV